MIAPPQIAAWPVAGAATRSALRSLAATCLVAALAIAAGALVPLSIARFTAADTNAAGFTTETLDPPTGVSATGGSSVVLTWTASVDGGASGYLVDRATSSGGTYSQVGTATPVSASSFNDSPTPGTYWYRLSTYFQNWTSATTTPVSATVTTATNTGPKSCAGASNAAEATGNLNGYESNASRACTDDSSFAVDVNTGALGHSGTCTNVANDAHRFWGYAFGLPATVTSIDGISVRADAALNNNGGTSNLCVQLSWDGGSSWTTAKTLVMTSASEVTYTFGGAADTWGRTWAVGNFLTANFRVRVIDATSQPNKDYRLDYLAATVSYTP